MKKVLLTSAVALAAFGAVQAVSADSDFNKLVADALGITAPASDANGLTMDQYNAVKNLVKTLREKNVALEKAKKTYAGVDAKFEEAKKAYSDAVYAVRAAKANNVVAREKLSKITDVKNKIAADFAGDLSQDENAATNEYGTKTKDLATKTKQLGTEADAKTATVEPSGSDLTAYAKLKKTTEDLDVASNELETYLNTHQPIPGAPASEVKTFNEERVRLEKEKSEAEVAKQEAAATVDTLKKEVKDLKDAKQAADKQLKVLGDAITKLNEAIANGTGTLDGKTLADLTTFVTEKQTELATASDAVRNAEENLNTAKSQFNTAKENAENAYKAQNLPFVLEDILKPAQPTPEPAPLQFGWNKDAKGNWTYVVDSKGKKATGWVNDKGTWYYLNAEGVMQTGWAKVGGTWYYLNDNGSMATGWVKDNGTWYYLNNNGSMATGWVKDNGTWYYLNNNGSMATGWYKVGEKWYYSYASGALAVNTTVNGYTVNENGEWVK